MSKEGGYLEKLVCGPALIGMGALISYCGNVSDHGLTGQIVGYASGGISSLGGLYYTYLGIKNFRDNSLVRRGKRLLEKSQEGEASLKPKDYDAISAYLKSLSEE